MGKFLFSLSFIVSLSAVAAPRLHYSITPEAGSDLSESIDCEITFINHRNTDPAAQPGENMSLATVKKVVSSKNEKETRTLSVLVGYGVNDLNDLVADARAQSNKGASVRLVGFTSGDKVDELYSADGLVLYRANGAIGEFENRSAEAQRLRQIIRDLCR